MQSCSFPKFSRHFLVPVLFGVVLSSGCVADKQMVAPYEGKSRRAAAMQNPDYEQQVVDNAAQPASVSPPPLSGSVVLEEDDILLPVLSHVNERIFSYEQKLVVWRSLREKALLMNLEGERLEAINLCGQQVEKLLAEYNDLHARLLGQDQVTTEYLLRSEMLLDLDKQDLEYLESECPRMSSGDAAVIAPLPSGEEITSLQVEGIKAAYAIENYDQVILDYDRLFANSTQDAPYGLTYMYGQALRRTRHEAQARGVYKNLLAGLRQNDQALWEFKLMQLIGDLDFALGDYMPATDQYNGIVRIYDELRVKNDWARQQLAALNVAGEQEQEVKAYANLLRGHLTYNADRDGFIVVRQAEAFVSKYPYSLVSSSADNLVILSRQQAEEWYKAIVDEVDRLSAEGQFQEALLTIERIPRTILPIEKQQELASKSAELTTTEVIVRETKELADEQEVQGSWNAGMSFLELKEYDKAIESFSQLLGTSYDARAKARINEAAGLAAQDDRRRAAELFVRSNRTHDLESRKKLLLSSRQLLQDILIKYPQSDLIEKVERNLKRIDEEIMAIDPRLLSAPVTVNGQAAGPSVDSMFE
jgi:hypothetical protein